MNLKITFESNDAPQTAAAFKSFVEDQRSKTIESVEVEQAAGKAGDQGIGNFLGSIITKLTGSSDAIKSFASIISRFLEMIDGHVIIEDGKGGKIVIPGGKKLSAEQIENIATKFTENK